MNASTDGRFTVDEARERRGILVAMGLIVLMIVIGMIGRDPGGLPKAAVERVDLDPGQAALALRTQLVGPECDSLLAGSSFTRDRQYVTIAVPTMGRLEVQFRRRGEFTVQSRSTIEHSAGCEWNDVPIPTEPFGR